MNNIFSKKQLLFKVLFSLFFLLFLIVFFEAWSNWLTLIGFTLAYLFGILLLFSDEQFLYKFYQEKIDSKHNDNTQFSNLASRNFIFLLALPPLSIFVLTSSGSILGIALVMAINSYLLAEMWQLKDEFLLFKDRFLAMSRIQTTPKMVKQICYLAFFYFVFLLLNLLF